MQESPMPPDDAPANTIASADQSAPLITGEALYLWTGAGAVLFVLVLLLVLLGRWRAGRRAEAVPQSDDFFQPAGDGAEITFDDNPAFSAGADAAHEPAYSVPELPGESKKKKNSAFANIFAKRDKPGSGEARAEPELLDFEANEQEFATAQIDSAPAAWNDNRSPAADWDAIERDARRRAEAEREVEERKLHEEEAAARWRAEEERLRRAERDTADRLASPSEASRFGGVAHSHSTNDEIVRTLTEVEEALHVQREAIQSETRNLLDSFARRFNERLDSLSLAFERRTAAQFAEGGGRESGADGAMLADLAVRIDADRREIGDALHELAKRIDRLAAAPSEISDIRSEVASLRRSFAGSVPPSAPAVQLADIVQNALAPGAYEFNARLANDRKADCLIRLGRPPGPIAIDASFPVEAFHPLRERSNAAVESEFRRTALRHIVSVAERLIVPGFTADSALLFLPSESMAAELHARFPDIIQDSYRARVWIVSPTTLLATLHTMSALLRDASRREQGGPAETDAKRALLEVERLGERIAELEKSVLPTSEPRDLRSANDAAEWRPAAPPSEQSGDLFTPDEGEGQRQTQSRPPFPLR